MQDTIPKPATPFTNGKIYDAKGDTVPPVKHTFMARLDAKASEKVELSRGTVYTTVLHLSCLYAIVYGGYIVWPYTDLFATSTQLYAPMLQIWADETVWGGLMIASGVLAAILEWYGKQAASFVMAAVFLSFSVLFFMGDAERPGGPIFGILAIFNMFQWAANKWARM